MPYQALKNTFDGWLDELKRIEREEEETAVVTPGKERCQGVEVTRLLATARLKEKLTESSFASLKRKRNKPPWVKSTFQQLRLQLLDIRHRALFAFPALEEHPAYADVEELLDWNDHLAGKGWRKIEKKYKEKKRSLDQFLRKVEALPEQKARCRFLSEALEGYELRYLLEDFEEPEDLGVIRALKRLRYFVSELCLLPQGLEVFHPAEVFDLLDRPLYTAGEQILPPYLAEEPFFAPLAGVLLQAGYWQEVRSWTQEALQQEDPPPWASLALASSFFVEGDYPRAFSALLEINNNKNINHLPSMLTVCALALNDEEKARCWLEEAMFDSSEELFDLKFLLEIYLQWIEKHPTMSEGERLFWDSILEPAQYKFFFLHDILQREDFPEAFRRHGLNGLALGESRSVLSHENACRALGQSLEIDPHFPLTQRTLQFVQQLIDSAESQQDREFFGREKPTIKS